MSKEIYISSTPHETRLAIVEHDALTEIYYERENEYTLAGSIYNGRVTRVLPGMQSSFVDIGLERDAFLYITDFMEEAGETADFEGNASHAEEQPRQLADGNRAEGRSETRRDQRDGRDRGGNRSDRGGNREPLGEAAPREARSTEPSDADLFNEAVAGLDPARSASDASRSGNRQDNRRGGRDRRPRNERGGNRENSASIEAPSPQETYAAPEPHILSAPTPVETEDLGEGAPGADGSRRWRGRRGRRGTRGERPAGDSSTLAAPANQHEAESPAFPQSFVAEPPIQLRAPQAARNTGPIDDAYPQPEESRLDLDASAEPSVSSPASDRGPRTDRGGRRGRNDRGRNRGGRDTQFTNQPGNQPEPGLERTAAPPRIPRGFAPSASLYKVEGADETHEQEPYGAAAEPEAPAEPFILPGEILSKYRPASEQPAAEPAPAAAPKSEFVAAGWDGGFVLPGETLRPRGPAGESRDEARSSSREDRGARGGRDRNDRGDRNDRNDRGGRGSRDSRDNRGPRPDRFTASPNQNPDRRPEASASQSPEASYEPANAQASHSVAEPTEPTYLSNPDTVASSHLITPLNSTFIAPPPLPEPIALQAAAEPIEYEPTEASASFRVNPIPPSEYRQAAPLLEAEPEAEFTHAQDVPLETAAFAEPASEAVEPVQEQGISAPVETDPADLHSVSPALQEAFAHAAEESQAQHQPAEFTSISETGEMHSELPASVAEPDAELLAAAGESAPIAHEAAVVSNHAVSFEPGSGMLEEEVLDDDSDFEQPSAPVPTLQAGAEPEQETLEGAADLASMLHDLSIDHITGSEPSTSEEDEDDFEEDFLEEDQDFQSETSSDDDEAYEQEGEGGQEGDEAEPALLDQPEHSEYGSGFEGEHQQPEAARPEGSAEQPREPRREGRGRSDRNDRSGRRDGRRDGRDSRGRRETRDGGFSSPGADRIVSDRPSSDRSNSGGSGRRDTRGGRNSMQATNLPAISDLLKPGQEILVQIAKEPIAKKGARITSHIALPGRFLVFMPTVSHTGVSRKIESDHERRRLKEILLSERGEASGGFIVRTAAAGASEEELRSDLRFLLNLWADIKTRSESSKSPALIYHDLNLVERVLRDQVTDNFSAIWVDTESQYEQVLRFLQRFQPSLIRRVKLYTKETPLFEQFGITEEINKALRSKVWLKSGGSIVINQTEALVAIDINTGKFVGKTARLEDTIVKTNLDAIPEIVRQIRLRDLGGIIIIDFIDMDERKNRNKVMAALEEELKSDRAPSKVLNFNDFGLIAITRKRVKQSLERTLSTTCAICAGTGMTKSPVTVCNDIYVEMRKMHKHLDRGDVMLRVHPDVVKQLKAPATHWLQEMEEMCGKTILVKSDPSLHPEQFDIH